MATEPSRPSRAAPKPPPARVTQSDLERYADEDPMRRASNDDRLREEQPPHHR